MHLDPACTLTYLPNASDLETQQAGTVQQVQQPQQTETTPYDPHRPADLRQRPSVTYMPLDDKQKVKVTAGNQSYADSRC